MSIKTTARDAARRLQFIERLLGPEIERATAEQQQVAAAERARLLAARSAELKAAEKKHAAAKARQAETEARAAAATSVQRAAVADANEAFAEAFGASATIDRMKLTFDARLAELGLQVIDETIARLHSMASHARSKVRYYATSRYGAVGFHPDGGRAVATPVALKTAEACEAAVVELDALRYDPKATPAEIETRCTKAVERIVGIGGREVWGGYETFTIDLNAFRRWVCDTTTDPEVRTRLLAKEE